MNKSLITLLALGVMALAPSAARADGRFGTDRGSRYSGGHSHSSSFFGVSVGFGSGGYHHGGGYGYAGSFTYGRGYGYAPRYYPRSYSYYADPCYRPSPVIVYPAPAPVIVAPAPVVYAPPVYYAAPRVYSPVYTSSYYYSSGGYYCGR
jgi:hypothetical protein